MTYTTIEYCALESHVGVIRLKQVSGEGEGLSRLSAELSEACSNIASDNDIWVVLLMGVEKLPLLSPAPTTEGDSAGLSVVSVAESISAVEKPLICGVEGDCLGLRLEVALACDIRVGAQASRFGFPHLEDGMIPGSGGTQRLPRLVGRGQALELVLTGKVIDAREACRIGLISRIVPGSDLEGVALGLAREMTAKAPLSLRYTKEAINAGMDLTLPQGLRLEADLYMLLHTSMDRTEGIKAMQEKRKARFEGK